MSVKKCMKVKSKLVAKLVTVTKAPCIFCQREVDDEMIYGKLYAIGDIQCHYFCVLLSCCLVQKGHDEEGLFGFMYNDILAEVERSKKHKCSYCGREGATLGCAISQCRKQFHLPCGREKNAVSLFHGNFKSFCQQHAPKQNIPLEIMEKAKLRKKEAKNKILKQQASNGALDEEEAKQTVCAICYEEVDGFPTLDTFWPPCCGTDAWFHRSCLQRMALSAGMHYLKCPLCNDKDNFYHAVLSQGFYVPDRDAAWELEQNAFSDIYERPVVCTLEVCLCPMGRNHDTDMGDWDIQLCLLCGGGGAHVLCSAAAARGPRHVCGVCGPAAPDLPALAERVERAIQEEQAAAEKEESRPVMRSRMSLRRTKQRIMAEASFRASNSRNRHFDETRQIRNTQQVPLSPMKMLEEGLRKVATLDPKVEARSIVEEVIEKFKKPRPLCEKRKTVNKILDELLTNYTKDAKRDLGKALNSPKKQPKKATDITLVSIEENEASDTLDIIKSSPETEIELEMAKTENKTESKEDSVPNNDHIEELEIAHTDNCMDDGILSETTNTEDNKVANPDIDENLDDSVKVDNIVKEKYSETMSDDDESSSSTFRLPPEFIADRDSDISVSPFHSPMKSKKVDIEKDSRLEISENDHIVNIDMVKIENCDKENAKINSDQKPLKGKVNLDLESFTNQYLNEVDKFQCNFKHKHKDPVDVINERKIITPIDFALKVTGEDKEENSLKRRQEIDDDVAVKKIKIEHRDAKNKKKKNKSNKDRLKLFTSENNDQNKSTINKDRDIIDTEKENATDFAKPKKRMKGNKKRRLKNNSMKLKIKFKKHNIKNIELNVEITDRKKKKNKKRIEAKKIMRQYLLGNSTEEGVIVKPKNKISPIKTKTVKNKSPDKGKQMSITNFFAFKPK